MIIQNKIEYIVEWIKSYCKNSDYKPTSLIIGVSGGIDSAVTSTLCAKTNMKTIAVSMPIKQNKSQHDLSIKHLSWLETKFTNVTTSIIDLNSVFDSFTKSLNKHNNLLALANSKSRLRMTTLYQIAQSNKGIVVGTGNKVEDFGVGFFTKYGDGGVDISPIADCNKSEIWEIGKKLFILKEIINAEPTDGLWEDSRNDEDQLGLTYNQIEEAMNNPLSKYYEKYESIRKKNLHKMKSIPVCKFKEDN
ncbi:MAG: NH(3)-dependent NAD(+) synthetase [Alphaproteobacteria bacterium MarineAlpha5_Bin9]|nr:MAG: NH(3)-dependent NAD(+) synthetase [Alphaproteobacteria bacterium MarineAlpha5_Bin9]|tara:strand:+ start:13376 stop:14119 length:744 start_codon:yes stop_codon:yes gene_type:complete